MNGEELGTTDSRVIYSICLSQTLIKILCIDDLMLAACRNDQDEMLEDVLKEGDIDINHADKLGDTALHYW